MIAIELGVVIALLAWLAISRVPSVRPLPAVAERARSGDSFATVAPVVGSNPQNLYATDDVVDAGSSAQVAEEQAAPEYVQEVAPELNAGSYYAAVEQVPVVSSSDCYVAPVAQFVEFVQSRQIIVVYNRRSFGRPNRCPPRPRFGGASRPRVQQRPNAGRLPPTGSRLAPRQNPRVGLGPRQIPSARPARQNHVAKARWDP